MIAAEFPGLFSYRDLLELDIRDTLMWLRQARIRHLTRRILELETSRLALAENKDYAEYKSGLQSQLAKVVKGDEVVIRENWDALKALGRRKKK